MIKVSKRNKICKRWWQKLDKSAGSRKLMKCVVSRLQTLKNQRLNHRANLELSACSEKKRNLVMMLGKIISTLLLKDRESSLWTPFLATKPTLRSCVTKMRKISIHTTVWTATANQHQATTTPTKKTYTTQMAALSTLTTNHQCTSKRRDSTT